MSAAAVFGMLAGVLASAIESIGDYYACARLAGETLAWFFRKKKKCVMVMTDAQVLGPHRFTQ